MLFDKDGYELKIANIAFYKLHFTFQYNTCHLADFDLRYLSIAVVRKLGYDYGPIRLILIF